MKRGSPEWKRSIFIKEMINAWDVAGMIKAYKKAYTTCKSDNHARVASYKLLQNPAIMAAIDEGKRFNEEIIKEAKKAELIRIAKEQVAHESQLDAKLSSIALGEHKRVRKVPFFNRETKVIEILEIEEEPTETDIVAAADKLYKRKGSYAPTTLKHEGGDTFIEMMKQLAKKK